MADPSVFDAVRIPVESLIALDNREYHFALQPYHYILRIFHIVSMAGFFGGIVLLDLRLIGYRATVPLRAFAEHALPWLYATFGIAAATGVALFFYDPVKLGARAYWTPKLIAIALGLGNALLFHRTSYLRALAIDGTPPLPARLAGAASLLFWTAAIVFSSLNTESAPRVLLH